MVNMESKVPVLLDGSKNGASPQIKSMSDNPILTVKFTGDYFLRLINFTCSSVKPSTGGD